MTYANFQLSQQNTGWLTRDILEISWHMPLSGHSTPLEEDAQEQQYTSVGKSTPDLVLTNL